MSYRIYAVDAGDDEYADEIRALHKLCFADVAPPVQDYYLDTGFWWLVYPVGRSDAVAFAGVQKSARYNKTGYLCRVGVLDRHRGHGLQRRLLAVRERKARQIGWHTLITDTCDVIESANNLIRAGYRLFQPEQPWAFQHSLYWRKRLR